MELKFYNSMTRQIEPFKTLNPGEVGMYTCGPTVYNYAHIGNFRAYLFEDFLRRTLEFAGNQVKQVMNLTDVDDKTIRGSQAAGQALKAYTKPYIEAFFADLKTLNVEPAAVYPAATDHIPEMLNLISALFDKGIAYKSDDGSVYFSVSKYENYGKLAHIDREAMRSGVRINADEYEKEGVGDFALWKGWDEKDGDVVWDAPWGKGRPGWHLECSAMSMKYLGESFDLHTGGIDNLFPHHENEIAQAEAVTGKPFVHTWMHCAHLRVNGQKMSKSLGNFFTLRDLQEKGYTGREIRYVLLNAHYRQGLNFTFEQLPYGEQGELVFTTLTKEGMPVLRYRTKDLCTLYNDPCPCGRTSVKMGRIMGRSDDMLIIRGINVFPSQVESVILTMPEFEPQYMLVVDRVKNLDTLQVQVEVRRDFFSDDLGRMLAMKKALADKLKSVLSISADVKLMEPGSIERSQGKSKHVIDNRKLV